MLEELGLDYEHIPAGDESDREMLRALNPNAKVPILQDGDTVVWESMAINLYLAMKHQVLTPATQEAWAHALQWSFWVATEVEERVLIIVRNRVLLPEPERSEEEARSTEDELAPRFAALNEALGSAEYLLGSTFTVADLNVASVLALALVARVDLAPYPNAQAWLQRCVTRPTAQKVFAQALSGA